MHLYTKQNVRSRFYSRLGFGDVRDPDRWYRARPSSSAWSRSLGNFAVWEAIVGSWHARASQRNGVLAIDLTKGRTSQTQQLTTESPNIMSTVMDMSAPDT